MLNKMFHVDQKLHPTHLFNILSNFIIVVFSFFRNAEIDCRDKDKKTPLMNAARKNNVETVKLLLQRGADVTVKDATDKTSLYMAAEDDCWEVLNVRIECRCCCCCCCF